MDLPKGLQGNLSRRMGRMVRRGAEGLELGLWGWHSPSSSLIPVGQLLGIVWLGLR